MKMNEKTKIKQISFLTVISQVNHYILSIIVIGFTVLFCLPLSGSQGYHLVSFILLFVVSVLATFMGIGPILLASALSSLVWNFFFIPPHYTFHIESTEDILMFGMFFTIALVNGVLTTRVRKQERLARSREERANALFQLTKELSKASGTGEILHVATREIKKHFAVDPSFILQDGNKNLPSFDHVQKMEQLLSQSDFLMAKWVFDYSQKAGKFTNTLSSNEHTCYPLKGSRLNPGVLITEHTRPLSGDKNIFWDTFLTQISNSLEREFLEELAKKARFLDESDRLYKTLFNSISHELRIPVSTIIGASDTLLNGDHSENTRSALYNEILTASVRLNRLIGNLPNMSRLESGRLTVRLDWYDINDLINKVTEDLKDELKPFTLVVDVPENMPLVWIDFGLMEQVLYNLLINSTQYAPPASEIILSVGYTDGNMVIEVSDRGPGFPESELKNVFRKFFRIDEHKAGGLGLGLSIAKGFVEAHRGVISIENLENGGARFAIKIPTEMADIKNLKEADYE